MLSFRGTNKIVIAFLSSILITDSPLEENFPFSPIVDWEDINSKSIKSEIFNELIEKSGYDKKLRPNGLNGSGPTEIQISLLIRSIDNIDDVKMQYAVQMTFRQEWIDERLNISKYAQLRGKFKYLQLLTLNRVWVPDLFFTNEKTGQLHKLVIPDFYTRVFPDGRVLQSYRITLVLSCPMNLRAYPLDIQTCPLGMESYGWTTKDIIIKWREKDAVVMATHDKLPNFWRRNYTLSTNTSETTTGTYSFIELNIEFERKFIYYLLQIYIPCSLLCLVSWITFFMDPSCPCSTEARVSLGVTSILATVTQIYGINKNAPQTSYLKALDIWAAFCQITVFMSLLECALVMNIMNVEVKSKNSLEGKCPCSKEEDEKGNVLIDKAYAKAKLFDSVSRILFPIIFCLFNVTYWIFYLIYYPKLLLEET